MNRPHSIGHFFSCIILVCLAFPSLAFAEEKILKVGVALGEPFVISQNNEFTGIAVDTWKLIADEQNLKYQLISAGEHIDDAVSKLAEGQFDVLIGPIVPTYERNLLVDFMQPYYLNKIGMVVALKQIDFLNAMNSIFNDTVSIALIIFFFSTILYFHIFWYCERKKNPNVPQSYKDGMIKTFWLHTLDIDLGKIPAFTVTKTSRFFWLFLLTLFFSSITAAITSALTIALSDQYVNYNSLDDFKNKKVTAVLATAPFKIAKDAGLNIIPVNDREEAFKLLVKGEVVAYVDYYPTAEYYLSQHELAQKLIMAHVTIKRDTFAFALPINSPLRHPLNVKLSSHQRYGLVKAICEKYFGENGRSVSNCEI